MKNKKVSLLKKLSVGKKGEVVELNEKMANLLIRYGVAKEFKPRKRKSKSKKDKKEKQ